MQDARTQNEFRILARTEAPVPTPSPPPLNPLRSQARLAPHSPSPPTPLPKTARFLSTTSPSPEVIPSAFLKSRNYRSSELGKAFAEADAGRILADGLKHFDLDEASLQKTAKGDWRKVAIARSNSERTTVRQDWIAERLNLKSASNVSQRVRHYRLRPGKDKSKQERAWEKRWTEILNSRTDPRTLEKRES